MRVLVVHADAVVRARAAALLRSEGFTVVTAANGDEALTRTRHARPALMLLDLVTPPLDSPSLARLLRAHGDVPVLLLDQSDNAEPARTAPAPSRRPVPFDPRRLMARVHAALPPRPPSRAVGETLRAGHLTLHVPLQEAWVGNTQLSLRPKEFDLLVGLVRHLGETVTRALLLEEVWGFREPGTTRTVDMHVKQLRAHLARVASDLRIETVRGVGYRLIAAVEVSPGE